MKGNCCKNCPRTDKIVTNRSMLNVLSVETFRFGYQHEYEISRRALVPAYSLSKGRLLLESRPLDNEFAKKSAYALESCTRSQF